MKKIKAWFYKHRHIISLGIVWLLEKLIDWIKTLK